MTDDNSAPEPDVAADLRLRGPHPKVTRLSRKVLIGLGATAAVGISTLSYWALQSNRPPGATELYNTDSRNLAEGLGNLPHDYTGLPKNVPQLGPPLPGDLGRPILNAQSHSIGASGSTSADAQRQQLEQETEAARTSHLFVSTAAVAPEIPALGGMAPPEAPGTPPAKTSDPLTGQNMQDDKLAFLNGAADRRIVSPDRLARPASPFILQAGTIVPAALLTGIRSDLPGVIIAQVTENVYDSPTGTYLLIPQGSRLLGQYDSQIAFAQSRIQLVWNRLILPGGRSIVLERQPGADTEGFAGLEDDVDNHWGALFKAALLSTLLSVGSQAGTGNSENNLAQAIRSGASNSVSQTGQEIVERNLRVQPTLTIRPGFPVRVIVNRDLVLAPYQG